MWNGVMKIKPSIGLMTEGNHKKSGWFDKDLNLGPNEQESCVLPWG